MFRFILPAFLTLIFITPLHAKPFEEMFPELVGELDPTMQSQLQVLDYKTGTVTIGDDLARFDLGENFYFLDKEDANFVLTSLWGNPPLDSTLGMIFPIDRTPLHDVWGIEVTYDDIGYVSDKDAADYDYDELLTIMREDLRAENEYRQQNGYETYELVGWAETPRYDADGHTLYWAKELAFEGSTQNNLNYNIRILGRQGVLVLNFIAGMDKLTEVNTVTPAVLAMTRFLPGNQYDDFDASIDKVAAIGIGGLIAGKVLTKTGFLAVALLFLKKFWFLALLPLVWLKRLVFNRQTN